MMARGGLPSDLGVGGWLPDTGEQVVRACAPRSEASALANPGFFSVKDLLFVSFERTHAT
jgi:hypothetical protein